MMSVGACLQFFDFLDAANALPTSQPLTYWRAASALTLIDYDPTKTVVIYLWTKLWS